MSVLLLCVADLPDLEWWVFSVARVFVKMSCRCFVLSMAEIRLFVVPPFHARLSLLLTVWWNLCLYCWNSVCLSAIEHCTNQCSSVCANVTWQTSAVFMCQYIYSFVRSMLRTKSTPCSCPHCYSLYEFLVVPIASYVLLFQSLCISKVTCHTVLVNCIL